MAKFIEVSTYNLEGMLQKVLINIDNICVIMPHDGSEKQTFISTNDFSCVCKESIDIVRNMLVRTDNEIVNNVYGKYEKVGINTKLIDSDFITDEQFDELAKRYDNFIATNLFNENRPSNGAAMKIIYKTLFDLSEDD